jgi:hypothetical protein
MKKKIFIFQVALFFAIAPIYAWNTTVSIVGKLPVPIPFGKIHIQGELDTRLQKNYDRLEESKYQPDHVFLTEQESGGWPGDTEGRTILGLVMDAQATHREPRYLDEIIRRLPSHLNSLGYMGPIYDGMLNEQQLAGNGWLLRGLCEYYKWKGDNRVLPMIRSIAINLFVKGGKGYEDYPIDPVLRNSQSGGASGNIQKTYHQWMLSTDIGCVFIGMDGAIQAYDLLRIPELKKVIDEMVHTFLSMDVVKIKAQTHATLTACRGLIRYADITGNREYVRKVMEIWKLYKTHGMTECYGNCNWFDRYNTWTEPCAIVDSYMLAVQLWQHTGISAYRDDAELIYYNAIAHAQRSNGGFGCDNCPGLSAHSSNLNVVIDEASWCCTMRGGEGLASAARYSYFTCGHTVYVPFYHASESVINLPGHQFLSVIQTTTYPFGNGVTFEIKSGNARNVDLKLASPYWIKPLHIKLNGKECRYRMSNGFIEVHASFKKGDRLQFSFKPIVHYENTINQYNTLRKQFRVFYGPLLLGAGNKEKVMELKRGDRLRKKSDCSFTKQGTDLILSPIYHLLDPMVSLQYNSKSKQVIFE